MMTAFICSLLLPSLSEVSSKHRHCRLMKKREKVIREQGRGMAGHRKIRHKINYPSIHWLSFLKTIYRYLDSVCIEKWSGYWDITEWGMASPWLPSYMQGESTLHSGLNRNAIWIKVFVRPRHSTYVVDDVDEEFRVLVPLHRHHRHHLFEVIFLQSFFLLSAQCLFSSASPSLLWHVHFWDSKFDCGLYACELTL